MKHRPRYDHLHLHNGKSQNRATKFILLAATSLVLLTTVHLYYSLFLSADGNSFFSHITNNYEKCDIFTGEWIPNPNAPYYRNTTCFAIQEHQNCMKFGRPDSDYLKWRWKPDKCELSGFDPNHFFDMMRDKSLAFVGDSVARNQMQSLMCLLAKVAYPLDMSRTKDDRFKRYTYVTYNFTMSIFWTTHLVNGSTNTATGFYNLYLDEYDLKWTTQISRYDHVIVSTGHWFARPLMLYENRELIGCNYCHHPNVTHNGMVYAYRMAFRNAFKAINKMEGFRGVTYLRTYAPSHFENGFWDTGGDCVRTKPFGRNETSLEGRDLELFKAQVEEFRAAEEEGRKRGLKFRLLDATHAMLLRPDGHPSRFGHWPDQKVVMPNDCVHWCLPGPVDTWNDFFFEILKSDRRWGS